MIKRNILFTVFGFMIILSGFMLLNNSTLLKASLPVAYILMGLGFGVVGHFTGKLLKNYLIKENSNYAKRVQIEQKDERNTLILRLAKEKAYNSMLYVFAGLIMLFALIEVDTNVVLMMSAAYIFTLIVFVFNFNKYSKEL